MKKDELEKLQNYLRDKFEYDSINVTARPKIVDSAEVSIDKEFIGVINKDVEDGETSYAFTMVILEEDLDF
jgi:hypothetical protein